MVMNVNKVTLLGRLGADPELRRLNSGKPVVNFRMATSEFWRDKNSGERKESTQWHNVVVFNEGICTFLEKYGKKGMEVYVEGQLQTRKWADQNGQDRYTTEIVLTPFHGVAQLGAKPSGTKTNDSENGTDSEAPEGNYDSSLYDRSLDDEIPF